MCVACGQELCKTCKGCHNVKCERYTEPTPACESKEETLLQRRAGDGTFACCETLFAVLQRL
jgi:hypothetical protein